MDICDAIDDLEPMMTDARSLGLWRRFIALATDSLLSQLPHEARDWAAAANLYDEGALSEEDLLAVRVRAWKVHDGLRGAADASTLSGLRAVMCRLCAAQTVDWHDAASCFVDFCTSAGVAKASLTELLQRTVGDVLHSANRKV